MPTVTSSQRRTSGPPVSCMRIAYAMVASRSLTQEALLPTLGVRGEAVGGQRFFHRVVEHADLANLARFLAVGHVAAKLSGDAHQLLDLLHAGHLGRAGLVPKVV